MKLTMKKIQKSIKASPYFLVLLIVATGVIVSFLVYCFIFAKQLNWQPGAIQSSTDEFHRLLDGQLVSLEKSALKPMAVILENHFDSRPVAGLENASIIYETVVEGEITRFLAIFDADLKAKKIGPVRSVRPFFVDLVEEWQAVLFHAGGSVDGLNQLKKSSLANVDEISADGIYFWRDTNRYPPHNLFTSANLIKRAVQAKNIETQADFSPWLFKSDQPKKDLFEFEEIKIDFSGSPFYQVKYRYEPANNDYVRYLNGQVHKTQNGIILKAKNIVIQTVDFEVIDSYGRLAIDLKSGGSAEIYQDGGKTTGFWRKTNGRTRFYDQADEEIRFNPGPIWIELVFD